MNKIVDKPTFDQQYAVKEISKDALTYRLDKWLCGKEGLLITLAVVVYITFVPLLALPVMLFMISFVWGLLGVLFSVFAFTTLILTIQSCDYLTNNGFLKFHQKFVEPLGRPRRRKKILKQSQNQFLKGTLTPGAPLVDYNVTQKVTRKADCHEIELRANMFIQDQSQKGWRDYGTPKVERLSISIEDESWREQVITAKLKLKDRMQEKCSETVLMLEENREQKQLQQEQHQSEDREIMEVLKGI